MFVILNSINLVVEGTIGIKLKLDKTFQKIMNSN